MTEKLREYDPIESKAITVDQHDGPGRVPMMLTAFEEEDNDVLDTAGYRGRYVIFCLIDGGVSEASHDPRKIKHPVASGSVKDFMLKVRRGWRSGGGEGIAWDKLEHGERYRTDEFPDVL